MIVPGSNLLVQALNLIASQPVKYFRNTGRTANGAGLLEATFDAVKVVRMCSVQPMPKAMISFLGLDMDTDYVTWFVPQNVIDLERDFSGDEIEWNKARYKCHLKTDWLGQDGWVSVVCVKLKAVNA